MFNWVISSCVGKICRGEWNVLCNPAVAASKKPRFIKEKLVAI
jgi:hypothetical protein